MDEFSKITKIASDDRVSIGLEFKELLHTWLMPGMSRYVCRYGTLGEGHEKLTPAQRYAQCHKEIWNRANEITMQKASALEAQADLIDAEKDVESAVSESAKLRVEARVLRAKQKLTSCLVNIEDSMRQLDEFNRVRLELKDEVEAQYPLGIEQSEEDNWKAVAEYRIKMERATGQPQSIRHVPLDVGTKTALGVQFKNGESLVWQSIENPLQLQETLKPVLQSIGSK